MVAIEKRTKANNIKINPKKIVLYFLLILLAVTTTVVSGYFSALTAYGFSRYKFKGGKALYAVVLGTMMIPGQLGLIGFYQLVVKLGMANSYLPLILSAMSIFTFIGTWNSYLVPLIILTDMNKYTLPIMQVVAKGVYATDYGAIYVCITISVVPIMLAFAFMSKKIVGGLTIGGVKG